MAINSVVLDVISKVCAQLPAPRRMLCLGYPDMLVTEPQLAALLGPDAPSRVQWREDAPAILRWHRLEQQMPRVAETRSVFALLGIESEFVDIAASRGVEIVLDLNQPAPESMRGRYDIVYDGGTMEHCFNVGQVMRNIASFARVGGFIVHVNPINYYNHGFFNFNPTFYHDWYTQSGNVMAMPFYAMHGPVLASQLFPVDATAKYQPPERSVLLVGALKKNPADPAWPMQAKYLHSPDLKA
ncbi:MAG TPA: hypothetical protein VH301_04790 [Usitatibacter sp.]|jgi:hypothetical protein|nr:hypothetical protein [Usitatibacter sp.]